MLGNWSRKSENRGNKVVWRMDTSAFLVHLLSHSLREAERRTTDDCCNEERREPRLRNVTVCLHRASLFSLLTYT